VHEGGIATPLIAHWPRGITAARGQLRHDVGHWWISHLRCWNSPASNRRRSAGAPALPGRSLLPAFARDGSLTREYVFFHHEGNRALAAGRL
jgi:arylsulfatase A-like enzyme